MAVVPINVARVSQNLRAFNLLATMRVNQAGLFRVQNQLATGQEILQPSDDPLRAAAAGALQRRLEFIEQVQRNLQHVDSALTEAEAAMQDAVNLLMDVQTVASAVVGDSASTDERRALVPQVQSVLDQLVAVANRPFLDGYLFSGTDGSGRPFELTGNGVLYRGDEGRSLSIVDTDYSQDYFTLSGAELFGAVSEGVQGVVDLDPALTRETRIAELRGATGRGVTLGRIEVSDGSATVTIDLSGADTVGDLLDRLNAELPGGLEADLTTTGLVIASGLGSPVTLTIDDALGGQAARDLGLTCSGLAAPLNSADLDPRLTLRTRLEDLLAGAGLDVSQGLTIRNGSQSATLDFDDAQTMEDILNTINQADVGVWARLADDGDTIEILNRLSGTDLTIAENGGTLATALGVRSLYGGTALAGLNDGAGIETVEGTDLRIVTADDTAFEVDLDGAETLQDVIDLINAAAGGAVTATLAGTGNGLQLTDHTTGAGALRVERANLSPALDGLGLDVEAVGGVLTGRDVNPIRTNSAFTALLELREALLSDDRSQISWAGQRLESTLKQMQEVQGRLASHFQAMEARATLAENENTGAQVLLSSARDVDLTEAVVRFQQLQVALTANLSTANRIMNLSLIDYLD